MKIYINCLTYILFQVIGLISTKSLLPQSNYKTIEYYAYYLNSEKLIVCSDKKFSNQEVVGFYEYKIADGFTCLLTLPQPGVFKINLRINVVTNEKDKDKNINTPNITLSIGDKAVNYEIDKKYNFIKTFWITFEKPNIMKYLSMKGFNDCKILVNSKFEIIQSGSSLEKLKLSFHINQPINPVNSISELSKPALIQQADKCLPTCKSGVCIDAKCYCKYGYMGEDCSIKMTSKGYRIPLWLLIIFFILAGLIGFGLTYLIYWLIKLCINQQAIGKESEEISISVEWRKPRDK